MGSLFNCMCSKYIILQHNPKPRTPVRECAQQTTDRKYADGKKPLPQLLICHGSITLFLTWLVHVAEAHRTGVKHCYCPCMHNDRRPVNPIPHQSTPRLHPHHHPPSSKPDPPLTSHPPHPYIHTCIIALISMRRHKRGPSTREHKYIHKRTGMHTGELFLTSNWKAEST